METMYPGKVNSPMTVLDGSITINATTINVIDGNVLPSAPNLAVIGTGEDAETILYGVKTNNALTTVTRGFQGTAKAWDSGTAIARMFTEYDYAKLKQNIETLDGISHSQNTDTDLDATFEATFGKHADKLSAFAATTSAELAGVISDELGSGKLVFDSELATNIVLCSNYANPDDAITAIGASNKTLLVTEVETCDINFTVPANVTVRFERGGKWTINTGITVTFNGQINAELYQVFDCVTTGKIVFGSKSAKEVYPDWWKENTTPGTTNMTTAIQAAFVTNVTNYRFLPVTYLVSAEIALPTSTYNIIGKGTHINTTAITGSIFVGTGNIWNSLIEDIYFDGNTRQVNGIKIDGHKTVKIDSNTFYKCKYGIQLYNDSYYSDLQNNKFRECEEGLNVDGDVNGANSSSVTGGSFENNTVYGIHLVKATNFRIIASAIEGSGTTGLKIEAATEFIECIGTRFEESGTYDVDIHTSSANNIFIGNVLTTINNSPSRNLNDYKEGTWTMGVSFDGGTTGITYSANTGYYTKIGNIVTVSGYLALTSKGTSTGAAFITGLPFIVINNDAGYAAVALRLVNIKFTNQYQANVNTNATTITLAEITNAGVFDYLTNADFANNSSIIVGCTYRCQ